ncbi:hypothetical protein Y032_0142g2322 [Ancylostoma ceylanicum]|uniref:Uncharacterized protein n=1 Tax=Ancylostoma ceylanicum TaxID=53326 RepID=A0A016T3E8_9BILA|nr:hypothetical protein Y032_0142g2322 [Ancylostoma ceylanicum]
MYLRDNVSRRITLYYKVGQKYGNNACFSSEEACFALKSISTGRLFGGVLPVQCSSAQFTFSPRMGKQYILGPAGFATWIFNCPK